MKNLELHIMMQVYSVSDFEFLLRVANKSPIFASYYPIFVNVPTMGHCPVSYVFLHDIVNSCN